jgi:hypothetical protein
MDVRALSAVAVGLLALASGCMTGDTGKKTELKKPDVTKPGVLPPPQELMKPSLAPTSGVIQAGGTTPAGTAPTALPPVGAAPAAPAAPVSPLAKLMTRPERKVPASEMAMVWRNRIAYLPDPARNGAMGAGLAGQMFLFGGPKLEFAQADGTLTVDLIDETPRPPGQSGAKPERWQFDKNTLRNLKTVDETFGKSYVLFLPWPAYKSDITRVRVSARYDPDTGHTLFSPPSVITIDTSAPLGAPVWDKVAPGSTGGAGTNAYHPQPSAVPLPGGMPAINSAPIPLGGPAPVPHGGATAPLGGAPIPIGGSAAPGPGIPMPAGGAMPMMPLPPAGVMPAAPVGTPGLGAPTVAMPSAPVPPVGGPGFAPPTGAMPHGASNEPLAPIMTTIQR